MHDISPVTMLNSGEKLFEEVFGSSFTDSGSFTSSRIDEFQQVTLGCVFHH